jgi:hypothetical protein
VVKAAAYTTIDPDRRRHLIDFAVLASHSEDLGADLQRGLHHRFLLQQRVCLSVISECREDEHPGEGCISVPGGPPIWPPGAAF